MLNRCQTLTSRPAPICSTPEVVEPPGFVPKYKRFLSSVKWPKPPPKLTQGETAVSGKKFTRAEGVTKICEYFLGTTGPPELSFSSRLNAAGTSPETAKMGVAMKRRA